jgi:hypothetical protein
MKVVVGMTPRQFQFVREYLRDMNATQAMIRAGYSPRTANKHMPRMMSHPEIRQLINAALADRNNKVSIEATALLEDIANAARSDLVDARANLQAATARLRSASSSISDVERLCSPAKAASDRKPTPTPVVATPAVDPYAYRAVLRPFLPAKSETAHHPWSEWAERTVGSAATEYDPLKP